MSEHGVVKIIVTQDYNDFSAEVIVTSIKQNKLDILGLVTK